MLLLSSFVEQIFFSSSSSSSFATVFVVPVFVLFFDRKIRVKAPLKQLFNIYPMSLVMPGETNKWERQRVGIFKVLCSMRNIIHALFFHIYSWQCDSFSPKQHCLKYREKKRQWKSSRSDIKNSNNNNGETCEYVLATINWRRRFFHRKYFTTFENDKNFETKRTGKVIVCCCLAYMAGIWRGRAALLKIA